MYRIMFYGFTVHKLNTKKAFFIAQREKSFFTCWWENRDNNLKGINKISFGWYLLRLQHHVNLSRRGRDHKPQEIEDLSFRNWSFMISRIVKSPHRRRFYWSLSVEIITCLFNKRIVEPVWDDLYGKSAC